MQGYEYGLPSPRPSRLKNSLLRPQSQQRSSSMSHQSSLKKTTSSKIDNSRQSIQLATTNEYYVQEGVLRRPFRESSQINLSSRTVGGSESVQNLEKVRKFCIQRLQRWMMALREQIHKQSTLIFNLERTIEQQNKEIQTKSSIIKMLISKLQHHQQPQSNPQPKQGKTMPGAMDVPWRRIEDVESRLRVITVQIDQERQDTSEKLELLASRLVKYFGKEVWRIKGSFFQFLSDKQRSMESITLQVQSLGVDVSSKLITMEKNIESIREGVKSFTQEAFSKDNASLTTQSKDSISLGSQRAECIDMRKEESMFSDYFFYPAEKEMPTVRIFQQLVKERQELPIRVFTDSSGRLKYWESRTFLFDRKGNFAMPSGGELAVLEQRGWIKLIAD